MSCPLQVNVSIPIQCRRIRLHLPRKSGACKDEIDCREYLAVRRKDGAIHGNLRRKFLQDPLDLLLACKPHLPYCIVQLYRCERLDKKGCAARGLIMNDTGEIVSVLLLDRDDIALVTHSDNRFLKVFLIRCIMQDCGQSILHTRLCRMQFTRNPAQFWTGIIAEIPMIVNGILQMMLHHAEDFNGLCLLLKQGDIQREITEEILHIPHTAHRTHDRAQFINFEDGSPCRCFQYIPQIIDSAERRCLHLQNLHRLGRLLMKPYDLIVISRRNDTAAAFFALHGGGKCCKPICDFSVFQNLE